MSFDINGVAGQGSVRQTQQNTSSQQHNGNASFTERQARTEQLSRQIQQDTIQKQQRDAVERSQEQQAATRASREDVEREVQQALRELKDVNLSFYHKLKYSIDHDENELIVKVIDPQTDEVIKELPPVAMQKFHGKLQQFIGLLVDEEA